MGTNHNNWSRNKAIEANNIIDQLQLLSACKIFKRVHKKNYGKASLLKLKHQLMEIEFSEEIAYEIEELFTIINSIRNLYPINGDKYV